MLGRFTRPQFSSAHVHVKAFNEQMLLFTLFLSDNERPDAVLIVYMYIHYQNNHE